MSMFSHAEYTNATEYFRGETGLLEIGQLFVVLGRVLSQV